MDERQKDAGIGIVKRFFEVMVFAVCLYFVLGQLLLPGEDFFDQHSCTDYGTGWNRVLDDGTRIPITIPGKYAAGRNEILTIENTLPETLKSGTYLCFRSCKQETKIYIDEVLRQVYSTKDTRAFGKTSAVAYVFLKLEPEDGGKKISIHDHVNASCFSAFYGRHSK